MIDHGEGDRFTKVKGGRNFSTCISCHLLILFTLGTENNYTYYRAWIEHGLEFGSWLGLELSWDLVKGRTRTY